ncbi:hypothetical protein E2C01_066610 [Portunus trituberculatus]|uniref:Uncharacterized protein n=1 Tax=Portunus trituberculatus TaxID=210409 RepID=A0A5B7HIL6_PORTR|nr:hypothetical protein [Portunus trituberculatus]
MVKGVKKGNTLEIYDRMSVEDLKDCEESRSHNLYELRPEAYRIEFPGEKKRQDVHWYPLVPH